MAKKYQIESENIYRGYNVKMDGELIAWFGTRDEASSFINKAEIMEQIQNNPPKGEEIPF